MVDTVQHRIEITPSQALPLMRELFAMKRPFLMHGSPGSAKSAILNQLAATVELIMLDMRLSIYEFIDLRGLPDTAGDTTRWKPPEELPKQDAAPGVLFLDEIGHAEESTQRAAFQLVLDRRLGQYRLPSNWAIAAATNYLTDNANVEKMGTALKNRFCHLYIRTDIKDWGVWALVEGGIHESVVGFLRFQPSYLQAFQDTHNDAGNQFLRNSDAINTPRTWEWVSDTLKHFGIDRFDECFPIIAGLVGMPAATGLRGFIKYYNQLPDIDDLIANPHNYQIPSAQQTMYALTTALSARLNTKNFENIMKFMKKAQPEFQAALIIDAIRRDPNLSNQPAFATWVTENSRYIF